MNTTKLTLGTVALIAAAGIGAFLGARLKRDAVPAPSSAGAELQRMALAALERENEQLKAELARRRTEAAATTAGNASATGLARSPAPSPTLEGLRVLTDLHQRKLANPALSFVTPAGMLTPAFVELFALADAEKEVLQRSVNRARERLADLERENATVSRDPKGNVVIAVKSFPEAGGAAYDDMLKTFAATLGPERSVAFIALGAEQVEKALGRFGASQRTVTFSQESAGDGRVRYVVNESYRLPNETGNTGTDFKTYQEMANRMGTISKLLPADFGAGR